MFGLQCQVSALRPPCVCQFHSTSLQSQVMRSRRRLSAGSAASKNWRAQRSPWNRKAVSTMSPPSSLRPNGMVAPVRPFRKCGKEPVIGGGALQKGEHGVQPRRRFFARDKTPCDGDDDRHDAEAAAADGDKIVLRIGLKAGPVPREKADRMRALPEKGETPPLHEIKQRVVGKSRGSCLRQRNSSPPDAGM